MVLISLIESQGMAEKGPGTPMIFTDNMVEVGDIRGLDFVLEGYPKASRGWLAQSW